MVSTRASSRLSDEPPSPTKPRRSPRTPAASKGTPDSSTVSSSATTTVTRSRNRNRTARKPPSGWYHAPSRLTLLWLAVSLPLVIWDTLYLLLRPHTMEGGSLFWPFWVPYRLYGSVDYVYGWPAWDANDGFPGAQASLNAVETAMYLFYLYEVLRGSGSSSSSGTRVPLGDRVVSGRPGARALLVGFSAAVMTFSKTALYLANEYHSGYRHVGHNTVYDLILLWIIPNTPWLFLSAYMTWEMGQDIINGLAAGSGEEKED